MMQHKKKTMEAFRENCEVLYCKYCSYFTFNIDELDEHIAKIHELNIKSEESKFISRKRTKDNKSLKGVKVENDLYKCTLCAYCSKKKNDMHKHLVTHCTLQPATVYRCSECTYETKRKNDMPKHMLGHCTNVQMFKCPECPYQTKRKNDLPKHLLCHKTPDSVPIYRCHYCDYFTKRKGDLPKHIINHEEKTNIKLYNCTICKYRTKRMNDLHKHMLVHCDRRISGVFKCLRCDFAADKIHKFSKHALSNCQSWDSSINMNRLLEGILDDADKEGVQVILDDDDEEFVKVESNTHSNYEGEINQKNKLEMVEQPQRGTMFNFHVGEFTVDSNVVKVEGSDQHYEGQNIVHYTDNAQYCT